MILSRLLQFNIVLLLIVGLSASFQSAGAQSARALFTPDETIAFRPAPDEYRRTAISVAKDLLENPPVAGDILLVPLDDVNTEFSVLRATSYFPGIWSVSARDVFNQSRYVTFTVSEDGITGKVMSIPEDRIYHFGTDISVQTDYLARMRPDQLPVLVCEAMPLDNTQEGLHPLVEMAASTQRQLQSAQQISAQIPNIPVQAFDINADTEITIDVLMVYSPAAETWATNSQNVSNIQAAIAQTMNLTQLAFDNSETGIIVRLAGTHLANYSGDLSVNMESHLRRLTTNTNGFKTNPSSNEFDGFMDEVHVVRNQLGADIVAMFVEDNTNTLGIAWRLSNYAGSPQLGFSVNSIRAFNGFTVAHEIGHNLGAAHGRNQSSNAATASGGLFEYSAGWEFFATNPDPGSNTARTTRHTVMHYGTSTSTRYPGFSNPEVSAEGGSTGNTDFITGVADNARAFREIKKTIAAYQPTRVDPPIASVLQTSVDEFVPSNGSRSVQIPITNTGDSDLMWSAEVVPGVTEGQVALFRDLGDESLRPSNVLFETSFEEEDGFVTGSFEARGGFRTFNPDRRFDISANNPKDGTRHLRMRTLSGVDNGAFVSASSPLFGRGEVGSYTAEFDIFLEGNSTSRFDVYIYSAQTGGIAAGVVITNSNALFFRARNDGNETFVRSSDTPILDFNRYYNLKMHINADDNTLSYYLDGTEFARVPMLQHRSFDWIQFGRIQQATTDFMDIDNLRVTVDHAGYSWLGFASPSGVVPPGESSNITVNLNAAGIPAADTREGSIVIRTSDPNRQQITMPVKISVVDPTSIENSDDLPAQVSLNQNYPNPFNPATTISFELPQSAPVQLRVYDVTGRVVATLINEVRSAGEHQAVFDASALTSGVYVYELRTPESTITRKMMLIK